MLIVVVEVKRELKNRHHRPCCVVIDARHVMMKANGVTDKVGQFPVARDEIANYAMIGIKASIFSLQIDPVPLPFQIHFPAIRREPLHQDRNATIMKNTRETCLVRKNITDRDTFIGDQHGQFGDCARPRPVRLECLLIVLCRHGGG